MWIWFLEAVGVCNCVCEPVRVRDPQMKPTLGTWLYTVDMAHIVVDLKINCIAAAVYVQKK